MQLVDILNLIEDDMLLVNQELISCTKSDIELINNVSSYIINSGGKRIRPAVILLFAKALELESKISIKLAVIAELIHTATILHDDVVDDSSMRRGKLTANKKFTNPAAVLVGDFVYTRAFQLISDLNNQKIMKLFTDAVNVIAEGEIKQLINLGDTEITEEKYFDVIYSKTAKLFEACCEAVVISKSQDDLSIQNYSNYGTYLGTAFQIIDDILDYKSENQILGKRVGDDLEEGKPTLPLIHLLHQGDEFVVSFVKSILKREKGRESLNEVLEMFAKYDSLNYSYMRAIGEMNKALDSISSLKDSPAKQALISLAELSIQRDF